MFKVLCCFIVLVYASAGVVYGQESIKSEVYESPERLEPVMPEYPVNERRRGGEGWVVLNFMVDQEGNVFEPVVIDSTGSEHLEKSATKALLKSKYKPATIDGQAVDGSSSLRYTFELDGGVSGAGRVFVRKYKKVRKYIDEDNQISARELLSEMSDSGAVNLYENAYLNLAKFIYELKYGDQLKQIKYLNMALSYERYAKDNRSVKYLPAENILSLRRKLFQLQLDMQYYAEAVEIFHIFESVDDRVAIDAFGETYRKIRDYQMNDSAYSISSELDSNGSWGIELFKDEFYIDVIGGKLEELKLRCTGKYVFFAYKVDAQYKLPKSWGECYLQVLGVEGSQFNLVQL